MTIKITKGVSEITALIGSIGTKQKDYRANVSSAVLSVVAHSVENGETSLVKKLLNEMFETAYRDLKVVKMFIESVTPIMLEETKDGRKTRVTVKACQFMKNDFDATGKTAKESGELSVKALKRHNSRCEVFDTFAKAGETQVKNLAFVSKEVTPDESRTVGVKYKRDIFAWYEDVEYLRKPSKPEPEIDPFAVLAKDAYEEVAPKAVAILKALEAIEVAQRDSQIKDDIKAMQDIVERANKHVAIREIERAKAVEVETLKKAKATEDQIAAWIGQREKRQAEGKEADNIAKEFTAYIETIKAPKAA